MIDSVLKGTGNSRFLKSAVPAGTSWADALAMLQAGTFPIDFNGINAEGFQQVGTPLNKANLLKDATAAQIGLPPSTTPDGMFQALGNTGELHVWRKTVFEPAGYRLGTPENGFIVSTSAYNSENASVSFTTSDTISVDSKGSATHDNPSGDQFFVIAPGNVATIQAKIRGKFVTKKVTAESGYYIDHPGLVYIPDDAILSCITNGTSLGYPYDYCYVVDRMQMVQPYPVNPVVTYPVSTNPNAYQEGSNAKEAGYVVGEVVTGTFQLSPNLHMSNGVYYHTGTKLIVSDDGLVSVDTTDKSYNQVSFNTNSYYTDGIHAGRFIQLYGRSASGTPTSPNQNPPFNTIPSQVVYIPEGTSIVVASPTTIDRYQPVTGYAAIHAGTTIEYLGKLGDKARVQVVSYVGTGTYGESNPQSISVDFKIKAILLFGYFDDVYGFYHPFNNSSSAVYIVTSVLKTSYTPNMGLSWDDKSKTYGKISADGKTFTWYTTERYADLNSAGEKYFFLVIG